MTEPVSIETISHDPYAWSVPTCIFRWLDRSPDGHPTHYERVLQQAWDGSDGKRVWQDVPTVRME